MVKISDKIKTNGLSANVNSRIFYLLDCLIKKNDKKCEYSIKNSVNLEI
jgi:hypothetical protein